MAKISGYAYLFIGIFVALVSYFTKNQSLKIFIYVGFLFGLIGIIKILFTRRKEKKIKHTHQHPGQFKRQQPIQHSRQGTHTKYCHHCGNIARMHDNFCSRCGTALHRR